MGRDELEGELRVLKALDLSRLYKIIRSPWEPHGSPCPVGVAHHVHLEVQSLDAIKSMFPVCGSESKGREQEGLGDSESYINLVIRHLWLSLNSRTSAWCI